MREILFRGKIKKTGEWKYGFVAKNKYYSKTEWVFVINDEKVYLTTAQMGAVYIDELKEKVTSLGNEKEEIKNSIDFLIYGF